MFKFIGNNFPSFDEVMRMEEDTVVGQAVFDIVVRDVDISTGSVYLGCKESTNRWFYREGYESSTMPEKDRLKKDINKYQEELNKKLERLKQLEEEK